MIEYRRSRAESCFGYLVEAMVASFANSVRGTAPPVPVWLGKFRSAPRADSYLSLAEPEGSREPN